MLAVKIRATDDPIMQKRLGRSVKGNEETWTSQARDEVIPAIRAKLSQNPVMQDYLLSTGDKVLGEASVSGLWGIGYTLGKPEVLQQNLWQGKHLLGEMLMVVRDELKSM